MNESQNDSIVIGLDIGSYRVRAVAGSLTENGEIQIDGYEEAPFVFTDSGVLNGQIINVKHCIDVIGKVLKRLSDKCDSDISSVNINISGVSIQNTKHGGTTTSSGNSSIITMRDVGSLVNHVQRSFAARDGHTILHTLPLDFTVNNAPANNPIGRVGVQVSGDFCMVTMPKVNLDTVYQTIKSVPSFTTVSGVSPYLSVDKTILSSLADSYSVLNEEDKKNGIVVVNIGNELTEISIFHKHGLRYRKVIPIAGRTITADIAEAFRLQIEEAEKLKLVYSVLLSLESITEEHTILVDGKNGLPSRQIRVEHIRRIVDLRLREIALIVSAEMTRSGLRDQLIHGCILTGGSANMYQIVDLFSSVLGEEIYTRVGSHLQNIAYVQGEESPHLHNPKYVTAIGLMLASLKPFDIRFPEYTELLLQPTSYVTPQIPPDTINNNPKQGTKPKVETSDIFGRWIDRIKRNSPPDVNDSYQ